MADDVTALFVGADINQIGDSVKWTDDYNIKSYEYVFLDFHSLEENIEQNSLDDIPRLPGKQDILKSIKAGNHIFIIMPKSNELVYDNRVLSPEEIVPGGVVLVDESGKYIDLDSIDSKWDWYFETHFNWSLRFSISRRRFELGGIEFICRETPIVRNQAEELISWSISYARMHDSSLPIENERRTDLDGRIVFIPLINDWAADELAISILEQNTNLSFSVDEKKKPNWTSEWTLPTETEVIEETEELEGKLERIHGSLDENREKIEEFDRYKTLLWGNEKALERLVPEVLEELGFDVEGEVPHGRDGLIHLHNTCFVLEITGTQNDIRDKKYRQLLGWVADAESEAADLQTEFVGLLIANPRRLEDPESRELEEYLPTHLQRRMKQKGFKLLLTQTLFDILCRYRDGNVTTEDVESALKTDDLVITI